MSSTSTVAKYGIQKISQYGFLHDEQGRTRYRGNTLKEAHHTGEFGIVA